MNVLIPLQSQIINGSVVQTVSARELHSFLEVATRFDDWISTRIKEYDFVENQDFVRFTENSVKPNGGRPSQEYYITLYMAKELSMVERNERGRQARKYFSEVSKLSPRGLRTVSLSTISLKIKILFASTKKWKRIMQGSSNTTSLFHKIMKKVVQAKSTSLP